MACGLDLPAGTAVRFEPGDIKTVRLVALAGRREVYGGSGLVMGKLDDPKVRACAMVRLEAFNRGESSGSRLPGGTSKRKNKRKS